MRRAPAPLAQPSAAWADVEAFCLRSFPDLALEAIRKTVLAAAAAGLEPPAMTGAGAGAGRFCLPLTLTFGSPEGGEYINVQEGGAVRYFVQQTADGPWLANEPYTPGNSPAEA